MENVEEGDRNLKSFITNVMNRPAQRPPSSPLLDADLKAITLAFQGVGTKEADLVKVFCNRSKEHNQQLKALYNYENKLDLLSRVELETSGRFQRLLEAMILTEAEFRAVLVKKAVDGIGTNEMMLLDVICTCNNKQINDAKVAYKSLFMIPMELRVKWDVSGLLQDNLEAIMQGKRPENGVDQSTVQADLDLLEKATTKKIGTDEKALVKMIATRSRDHLAALNVLFVPRNKDKKPFIETIKHETSGWAEKAFVANFTTPAQWAAFRIFAATKGIGTDEESLMRMILMPTQGELKAAIRILNTQYKTDLVKLVNGELFGNVKSALAQYVDFVNKNVTDPGDSAAAAASTIAPASALNVAQAASANLAADPHANRVWKSLQEQVDVYKADNAALRAELAALKAGGASAPTKAREFVAEPEERSFKF